GSMREAVPVEKARAQAVFEEISRARVDPGILQATEGNNYKIRVYPIPARGERRVRVRYAETLPARGAFHVYRLPLEFAKGVPDFALTLRVASEHAPTMTRGTLPGAAFRRDDGDWAVSLDSGAGGAIEVTIPESSAPRAWVQRFDERMFFH